MSSKSTKETLKASESLLGRIRNDRTDTKAWKRSHGSSDSDSDYDDPLPTVLQQIEADIGGKPFSRGYGRPFPTPSRTVEFYRTYPPFDLTKSADYCRMGMLFHSELIMCVANIVIDRNVPGAIFAKANAGTPTGVLVSVARKLLSKEKYWSMQNLKPSLALARISPPANESLQEFLEERPLCGLGLRSQEEIERDAVEIPKHFGKRLDCEPPAWIRAYGAKHPFLVQVYSLARFILLAGEIPTIEHQPIRAMVVFDYVFQRCINERASLEPPRETIAFVPEDQRRKVLEESDYHPTGDDEPVMLNGETLFTIRRSVPTSAVPMALARKETQRLATHKRRLDPNRVTTMEGIRKSTDKRTTIALTVPELCMEAERRGFAPYYGKEQLDHTLDQEDGITTILLIDYDDDDGTENLVESPSKENLMSGSTQSAAKLAGYPPDEIRQARINVEQGLTYVEDAGMGGFVSSRLPWFEQNSLTIHRSHDGSFNVDFTISDTEDCVDVFDTNHHRHASVQAKANRLIPEEGDRYVRIACSGERIQQYAASSIILFNLLKMSMVTQANRENFAPFDVAAIEYWGSLLIDPEHVPETSADLDLFDENSPHKLWVDPKYEHLFPRGRLSTMEEFNEAFHYQVVTRMEQSEQEEWALSTFLFGDGEGTPNDVGSVDPKWMKTMGKERRNIREYLFPFVQAAGSTTRFPWVQGETTDVVVGGKNVSVKTLTKRSDFRKSKAPGHRYCHAVLAYEIDRDDPDEQRTTVYVISARDVYTHHVGTKYKLDPNGHEVVAEIDLVKGSAKIIGEEILRAIDDCGPSEEEESTVVQ